MRPLQTQLGSVPREKNWNLGQVIRPCSIDDCTKNIHIRGRILPQTRTILNRRIPKAGNQIGTVTVVSILKLKKTS
jgi:hypothetical protein